MQRQKIYWVDKTLRCLAKFPDNEHSLYYVAHVRFFGLMYFSELFLLWVISGSTKDYNPILTWLPCKQPLLFWQSIAFLLGGLILGFLAERARNKFFYLRLSISIFTFSSLFAFILLLTQLDGDKYWFSLFRLISCFGLAGGIGINLVVLSYKKDIEPEFRSKGIALFSGIGALGTVTASLILFTASIFGSANYGMNIVLILGFVWGFISLLVSRRKKIEINSIESNKYFYKINTKNLESTSKFIWKGIQLLLLGLPTFYFTSLLAINSGGILIERIKIKEDLNLGALCLGIEYFGMTISYFFLCYWPEWKILSYFFGENPIKTNRKALLIFGCLLQIAFLYVLFFTNISDTPLLVCMFLGSFGVGNWAVVLMLVVEEFRHIKFFAACLIPNLMRGGLAFLFLGQNHMSNNFINNFQQGLNPDDKAWLGLLGTSWVLYILLLLAFYGFRETGGQKLNNEQQLDISKLFNEETLSFFKRGRFRLKNEDLHLNIHDFIKNELGILKAIISENLLLANFTGINFYFKWEWEENGTQKEIFDDCGFTEREKKSTRIKKFKQLPLLNRDKISLVRMAIDMKKDYALVFSSKLNPTEITRNENSLYWNLEEKHLKNFFSTHRIINEEDQKDLNRNRDSHIMIFQAEPNKDYFAYYIRPHYEIDGFDVGILVILYNPLGLDLIESFRLFMDLVIMSVLIHENKNQSFDYKDKAALLKIKELIKSTSKSEYVFKEIQKLTYSDQILKEVKIRIKKEMKNYISQDKCSLFFNTFEDYFMYPTFIKNHYDKLKSDFLDLEKKNNEGLIEYSTYSRHRNKFIKSIQDLIDRI